MRQSSHLQAATLQIAFYFAVLFLFVGLGAWGNGIVSIYTTVLLQDDLNLSQPQLAVFRAIAHIPASVGFLLGFLRDRWRPFNWGDRGYFLLTPPLIAYCYIWMGLGPLTYQRLLTTAFVNVALGVMLGAAVRGLTTTVAQREAMPGRLAALFLFINHIPTIIGATAGGWLTDHVTWQTAFFIAAGLVTVVAGLAFWKPRAVFEAGDRAVARTVSEGAGLALQRLIRHRALYPAALILLIWNFAPGWGTPLDYYLTQVATY